MKEKLSLGVKKIILKLQDFIMVQ